MASLVPRSSGQDYGSAINRFGYTDFIGKPHPVAKIEFRAWTHDQKLRHQKLRPAPFKGLRDAADRSELEDGDRTLRTLSVGRLDDVDDLAGLGVDDDSAVFITV